MINSEKLSVGIDNLLINCANLKAGDVIKITGLTKLGVDKSGYRTIFNCNEAGGQTVYHIHLHLIGGRSLVWPPG